MAPSPRRAPEPPWKSKARLALRRFVAAADMKAAHTELKKFFESYGHQSQYHRYVRELFSRRLAEERARAEKEFGLRYALTPAEKEYDAVFAQYLQRMDNPPSFALDVHGRVLENLRTQLMAYARLLPRGGFRPLTYPFHEAGGYWQLYAQYNAYLSIPKKMPWIVAQKRIFPPDHRDKNFFVLLRDNGQMDVHVI